MSLVSRTTVRSNYLDGVSAVETITAELSDEQWERLACGTWSAAATVRHLRSVADWYHAWLDRAADGDASAPFPVSDMDRQTAQGLASVAVGDPSDTVDEFARRARSYLDRIDDETWDLPYGYPAGTTTAGLHAGIAAVEWHVHAWDLSTVLDRRHVPADPATLLLGAADCEAEVAGRVSGRLMRTLAPLAARRTPWQQLLRRIGRDNSET